MMTRVEILRLHSNKYNYWNFSWQSFHGQDSNGVLVFGLHL